MTRPSLAPHPRLLSAMSGIWAINPLAYQQMLAMVVSGVVGGMQALTAEMDPKRVAARSSHLKVSSLWSDEDEYFDPFSDAHVRPSGIGVIPIRGPQFDRAWMCFQGYDQHRSAIAEMSEYVGLRGVIMPICSPGGMCIGRAALTADIRALREIVPVYTVADSEAGSAAEDIACQGSLSFAHPDGTRGHIGTWVKHDDLSALYAKEGIAPRYYYRGAEKIFFADDVPRTPITDEVYERGVQFYYDLFIASVAAGRPDMTPEAIKATEARIYYGAEAVDVGLADGVIAFEDLLYELENNPGGKLKEAA